MLGDRWIGSQCLSHRASASPVSSDARSSSRDELTCNESLSDTASNARASQHASEPESPAVVGLEAADPLRRNTAPAGGRHDGAEGPDTFATVENWLISAVHAEPDRPTMVMNVVSPPRCSGDAAARFTASWMQLSPANRQGRRAPAAASGKSRALARSASSAGRVLFAEEGTAARVCGGMIHEKI